MIAHFLRLTFSLFPTFQPGAPILFVKGQLVQFPIVLDIGHRHPRIREIEAETYLPIRAEQGLHTDVTPEITSCRAILPPVEASTEDVPAKPANVFVCIHLLMKLWGGGRPPRYLFYIIFTRHRQPPDRRRISPTPCLRLIPCPPRCPSYCMAHLVFRARPVPAKGMLRCRGRSRPRNN